MSRPGFDASGGTGEPGAKKTYMAADSASARLYTSLAIRAVTLTAFAFTAHWKAGQ